MFKISKNSLQLAKNEIQELKGLLIQQSNTILDKDDLIQRLQIQLSAARAEVKLEQNNAKSTKFLYEYHKKQEDISERLSYRELQERLGL